MNIILYPNDVRRIIDGETLVCKTFKRNGVEYDFLISVNVIVPKIKEVEKRKPKKLKD